MNHEREQQRARSPVADLEYDTEDTIDLEPGQVSRSAFLNKPDQAISSGLGHRRDLGFSHGASRRPALDGLGVRGRQGRTPTAALRKLLLAAATSGRGAVDALAAADPTTAAAALRELRTMRVPGRTATALQLVARADNGEAGRLLGRGSTGAALPDDDAARLGPHVGKEAAGAARLHTDDTADLVAAAHDARAVTLGHAIYFARGEYLPGTARGDELLAHELAHVAQAQRGELPRAAAKGIDAGGSLDPAEAEADLRAKHAVIQLHPPAGAPPPLAQPSGQPASKDDRAAKLAAQRQRLSLASHAAPPMPATPVPAESKPQAPVPHPPPKLARPPAPAATRNAYVEAFDAPPSKQATELWADAGTRATTHDAAAQAKFDAELKPFPVVLDGRATPAAKVNVAGPARTNPPAAGVKPPAAKLAPTPAAPPSKAAQAATKPVKPTADKTQMKAEGQKALDALPTTAPVKTDPGPAPVTDLAGNADPARALGDHHHAVAEGTKALDDAKAKLVAGPGPAQIQPTQLDEKLAVPKAEADGPMPALPTVEGMVEFQRLNLPGNVHAAFDQIAKPKMAQSLAEAKAKLTEAETKRDADRAKAVGDAHTKVEQAHADADKQQQTHIAETRTQITSQQASTLAKQANEVKQLDQQSSEKKQATLGKVNDRIARDQAQIDSDYQAAHKKADDHKKQGEAAAAKKKKEAEDKKGDDSWWAKAAEGLKSLASEIDQALDAASKAIGEVFDAVKHTACKLIDAAHDFVSHTLSEFGDWLKSKVTSLVDSVVPGLTAKLHQFVDRAIAAGKAALQKVSDGLKKSVTSVCGWLKSAASAVAKGFKAAVEMATKLGHALITGDWKAFGKMVLEGVLSLLGIDSAAFYAFIGKVGDSIGKIIAHPGAFVGHLVDAVKLGFHQFGQHFWAHLQRGLMEWLFGTISKTGITLPAKFDLAGVFDVVCQVLGLTRPRMRDKVVKLVGEKNTARFESILHHIEALMTGGFAGLWEQVQQDLSGLWDTILSGVKQWLITQVVEQAIRTLAMMWNPIGALLKLIETAWNLYKWVRENAQRIAGLLHAVVDSMANIVDGNIGTAANLIESSLARLVPIAISLFANLLGIGGIAETVKGIIAKVQAKVDQAIDKLIARVVKMFKGKDDSKDGKDEKNKGKDGEQEVPKSLAEPKPAKLENANDKLKQELGHARAGQVIFQKSNADPKKTTKNLLAQHPDAKFDKASGRLTLPPLQQDGVAGATSLVDLGQRAAQQTGVSKVTLDKTQRGIALRGHINPDVLLSDEMAALADNVAVALYRGLHFEKNWDDAKYDAEVASQLVKKPQFADAAYEMAGVPRGSEAANMALLQEKARQIQDELLATMSVTSVKKWWIKRPTDFDNLFFALLERYVNRYREFKNELVAVERGQYSGLAFHSIPFISTSKLAMHAAMYALGKKIKKTEQATLKRIGEGTVVGRVFSYVFTVGQLKAQGAVDIRATRGPSPGDGPIRIRPYPFREGEVTFSGSIPGENVVGQTDAEGGQGVETLARTAQQKAKSSPQTAGGLHEWAE